MNFNSFKKIIDLKYTLLANYIAVLEDSCN